MVTTDDCFDLIRSLQPNEKRYFKLFAAQQGWEGKKETKGVKQYIKLFDAMVALQADNFYDELKLKKKLKDAAIIRNLPSMKNHLVQLISKSLRNYYSEKDIETRLYELLQNEKIYKEKRLNELRHKAIQKAKTLAYEYEKYNLLLEIISREYDLEREMNQKDLKKLHIQTVTEERSILDLLENEYDYHELGDFLFIQQRTEANVNDPKILKVLEQLAQSELLTGKHQPGTFRAKLHYYRSLSLLAKFRNDAETSWGYSRRIIQLYQDHPHMIESNVTNYKMALNNYLGSCHRLQKYDEFDNILNEMKALPSLSFDDEGEVFQDAKFYELLYLLNTNQIDRAIYLTDEIEKGLELYRMKINDARRLSFYYNMAVTFFLNENFDRAADYCNLVINYKNPVRSDIRFGIRLMDMVCHYEMGNTVYLSSLIKNNQRYLRKEMRYSEFEKKICELLLQLIKTPNATGRKNILLKHHKEGIQLKNERKPNLFEDEFLLWVSSRIHGNSIRDEISYRSGK